MLDKLQQQTLKRLVRDDSWDVLMRALADYIEDLHSEPVTGTNAFETLRMLHLKQGKVEGLTEFFDKVEKGNLSDD